MTSIDSSGCALLLEGGATKRLTVGARELALQGAWPQPSGQHRVQHGAEQRELGAQVDPAQQPDHDGEASIHALGRGDPAGDDPSAKREQQGPPDARQHRARRHRAPRHVRACEHSIRDREERDVEHERGHETEGVAGRAGGEGRAGDHGSGKHEDAEQDQHQERPPDRRRRARPALARDVPDRVHRDLRRPDRPESRPRRQQEPDHDREPRPLDRANVVADLRADHRELRQRRVKQALLQLGVIVECVAGQRGQDHQQREQREEAVVRDRRGQVAGAAVAEALDDCQRDRRPRPGPLEAIERADRCADIHLPAVPPTAPKETAPRRSRTCRARWPPSTRRCRPGGERRRD